MALGIVVLNYNDYKTTIKFLDMIKEYKNINKVVVVDNNSKDNSVREIKKYVNDKIILLESKKNNGYGAGNNIGIEYLRKINDIEYIVISNPDIEFKESDLEKLISFLESNKSIAIASGRIVESGKYAKDGAWRLPSYSECLLQTIPIIDKKVDNSLSYPESYFTGQYSIVDTVKGCFFIARAKVLEEIGYFDEDTFLYYEENILGYKLKKGNYPIGILNDVNIIHEHGVTINKALKKIEKFKILNKSRIVYMKKYLKSTKIKMNFYNLIEIIGINIRKLLYRIQDLIK
ncbi:glycosyltransferase family 2 protein [Clostridium cuniculi]|uniref:glycosyltransferase family 2 protein n=1 Tax=Clostridium cuniculi TaxID=2548455 RepID=UPI0011DD90CB|nr:glycosyltransferase family 2 protein [Clostridium cuniculi]